MDQKKKIYIYYKIFCSFVAITITIITTVLLLDITILSLSSNYYIIIIIIMIFIVIIYNDIIPSTLRTEFFN